LVAEHAVQDLKRAFVQLQVIHFTFAGYHRFTETIIGINDELVDPAGDRVDGETHAGHFGFNLALDDHRHASLALGKSLAVTVRYRAVAPKRDKTIPDALEDRIAAADVQISIVLAREGGLRQVFKSGRGAYRKSPARVLVTLSEPPERG